MKTPLPAKYADLAREPGPLMLLEALRLHGTLEMKGPGDNPTIVGWADEVAKASSTAYTRWAADWYNADSIAWCGLFMAVVAVRASQGRPERMPPPKYLAAADWVNFGKPVPQTAAMLGDVLIFTRDGGGHVGLYVGEDADYFHVLGGNQADAVNITRIAKKRCAAVRRPIYNNQPANVRKIHRSATGAVSTNEA